MSAVVTVTGKQGSIMGTVIASITDPHVTVRDVNFYISVPERASGELGPHPPDIVRRPSPGLYEKDVVLDPEFKTLVRVDVITEPLGSATINGSDVWAFDPRNAAPVGPGEVRVQDADTPATLTGTLAFQGAVVRVLDGVATFNLDDRYVARDGAGGIVAQGIQTNRDSSASSGGVALYPIADAPDTFGIFVRGATHGSTWGNHGYLTGDWNVYLNIDNSPGRGWVFRNAGTGNVASIRNDGAATFAFVSSPGGARVGPYLNVGVAPYESSIRRADGGPMYLQSGGGGFVVVGDPSVTAYRFSVLGDVYAEGGWLRTNGSQGWYNETHGGGIHMRDSTWVRTYNDKGFAAANLRAEQFLYGADASTRLSSDSSFWHSSSAYGMRFSGHDGSTKGYVYFSGDTFGLLHGGGGWALATWSGGGGHLYGAWSAGGAFGASRLHAGYDSGRAGSVSASDGFRSSGSTGWYNDTYQTGIYSEQTGYVRTYGESGIKVGSNGVLSVSATVETDTTFGLYFGADRSPAYGIYRAAGSWNPPYPDLRIAFHTGIQIGALTTHGGTRFYSDSDMVTELMSVGNGNGDVRIANSLMVAGGVQVSGNFRVSGSPTDVHGNSLASVHLGSYAPANARPGTLWIQV